MHPARQKVWADGRNERQNYIPPTSSGDNKIRVSPEEAHAMIDR